MDPCNKLNVKDCSFCTKEINKCLEDFIHCDKAMIMNNHKVCFKNGYSQVIILHNYSRYITCKHKNCLCYVNDAKALSLWFVNYADIYLCLEHNKGVKRTQGIDFKRFIIKNRVNEQILNYFSNYKERERKGIFIPCKGVPYIVNTEVNNIEKLFSCDYCYHTVCGHLNRFGYDLCMFNAAGAWYKEEPVNPLASFISWIYGEIHGPVIILDDKKELTLEDLTDIINKVKSLGPCEEDDYYQ